MKKYTKEELIAAIKAISERGWIQNTDRTGNHGAMGNTLEDLLGIDENNLPIPNAAEWELKVSRTKANPLMTLCHVEPSPRAMRLVPQVLLPYYGWQHQEAGIKYAVTERSFRQTMYAKTHTDRGFIVRINDLEEKIEISFDASKVDARHADWLASVEERIGLGQLDPQPYWGFKDLEHIIGQKLTNVFHVVGQKRASDGIEFFRYDHLYMLKTFSFTKFLELMRNGVVYVDIDARSGHNHGTKFRVKEHSLDQMYAESTMIF